MRSAVSLDALWIRIAIAFHLLFHTKQKRIQKNVAWLSWISQKTKATKARIDPVCVMGCHPVGGRCVRLFGGGRRLLDGRMMGKWLLMFAPLTSRKGGNRWQSMMVYIIKRLFGLGVVNQSIRVQYTFHARCILRFSGSVPLQRLEQDLHSKYPAPFRY